MTRNDLSLSELNRSERNVTESNVISAHEYGSGDIVEPGVYVDVENGAVVQVNEADELPTGRRLITYRRRFRRVAAGAHELARVA